MDNSFTHWYARVLLSQSVQASVDGRWCYFTVDKIGVNDDSDDPDERKLHHETRSRTFKERPRARLTGWRAPHAQYNLV